MNKEKEQPVSVNIGVDLIEHKLDLTGKNPQDGYPPRINLEEPCPECGATRGFQVAIRADNKETWVFCMKCGIPVISLAELSQRIAKGD